eukprot:gene56617-biopygen52833
MCNQTRHTRVCSKCEEGLPEEDYGAGQFRRADGLRVCRKCSTKAQATAGITVGLANIELHKRLQQTDATCSRCNTSKDITPPSSTAVTIANLCKVCIDKQKDKKPTCAACGKQKQKEEFA